MVTFSVSDWLVDLQQGWQHALAHFSGTDPFQPRPSLSELAQLDDALLPPVVRDSAVALRYLRLLGPLDWSHFPDRPDQRFWQDCAPVPYAAFAAAYLVKLDQHLPYLEDLRLYLVEHPALVWVLGFPLVPSSDFPWGFDVDASLPTHRHLSRLLRQLPNAGPQFLLDETVRVVRTDLQTIAPELGECVSVDTKHLIAWVAENNPKAYIKGKRYDKHQQPAGDPDCRLGCKRRTNQRKASREGPDAQPITPTKNPVPAKHLEIGEYFWGYGSGVVATRVAGWCEIVLAELTQPFDQPDVSYFQPLLTDTERRLGHPPRFGAFDAAFDAFYVYEYFANAQGFAAVPLIERGGRTPRSFSEDGLPLCAAQLPMPLKYTYFSRTARVPHECGQYVCPLRYPETTGQTCPIRHKNWRKGGCMTRMATSIGARLRYQLDRHSEAYQTVFKQRTATERINSQAVDFGIERPKLRNGQSIANANTLTYVLINLHALQRIRRRLTEREA